MLISCKKLFVLLLMILGSCIFEKPRMEPRFVQLMTDREAIRHHLEDSPSMCTIDKALDDLGLVTVHVYDSKKKKYIKKKENLRGVKANPISSNYVAKVLINYHLKDIHYNCERQGYTNAYLCKDTKTETVDHGQKAFLCKKEYPRDSLENRILVALSSVNETMECMANAGLNIPRVEILVEPNFEVVTRIDKNHTHKYHKLNNASWTNRSTDGKNYGIHFLPMTRKFKKMHGEIFLSQAVGSHEAGHHGFYLGTDKALYRMNIVDDNSNESFLASHLKRSSGRRTINHRLVLAAISEGVADLTAYYCLYYNETSHLRFSSRERNIRDLAEDYTSTGETKALTIKSMETFFNPNKIKQENTVNDQDIHIVGGRIVFGVDRFWGKNTPTKNKLTNLSQWITKIGKVKPEGTPIEYMGDLIREAIEDKFEIDKNGKARLTKAKCSLLKENFPYLYSNIEEDETLDLCIN